MAERGTVIDYRYPDWSNTRLDTPVVAIIILGLTSFILGVFTLNIRIEFTDLGRDSVSLILYILSGLLLIMSVRTLRNHIITESIFLILAAFSAIIYTLSSVQNDSEVIYSMALFALGFVACTFIFKSRGEYFMAGESISFAAIILIGAIMPEFTGIIADVLLIINGTGLLLIGGFVLAGYDSRTNFMHPNSREMEDDEFPEVVVSTAGVILFGIMSFSVGVRMISEEGLDTAFIAFKFAMGVIVLAIGIYATHNGIAGEGLTMTLVSISSIIYAVSMLLFGHVPHYLDMILGALLMPIALAIMSQKEYLLGLMSILLASVMLLEAFWDGSEILEILIMSAKIVATGFALITWYTYDLGSKPRFILYIEKKLKVVIR